MIEHDVGYPTRVTTERPNGTVRVQHLNADESRTHQSFKDEVDVNKIIKRHRDTRVPLPSSNLNYADVSEITDYRDALDTMQRVGAIFAGLPAATRSYFKNDVALFLDYANANTPETVDQLVHGPPSPPATAEPAAPSPPATAEPAAAEAPAAPEEPA